MASTSGSETVPSSRTGMGYPIDGGMSSPFSGKCTGGGSSFSMLRTMAAAYEIGQLRGTALHPAQLWWLATAGSADALGAGARIGTLKPGMEADLIAVDLASTPAIAQRAERAEDLWQALFPTIMMGDDRAIAAVWVAGKRAGGVLPEERHSGPE